MNIRPILIARLTIPLAAPCGRGARSPPGPRRYRHDRLTRRHPIRYFPHGRVPDHRPKPEQPPIRLRPDYPDGGVGGWGGWVCSFLFFFFQLVGGWDYFFLFVVSGGFLLFCFDWLSDLAISRAWVYCSGPFAEASVLRLCRGIGRRPEQPTTRSS